MGKSSAKYVPFGGFTSTHYICSNQSTNTNSVVSKVQRYTANSEMHMKVTALMLDSIPAEPAQV